MMKRRIFVLENINWVYHLGMVHPAITNRILNKLNIKISFILI